jgi:transcriptional regulator with XRE-family HTH domain
MAIVLEARTGVRGSGDVGMTPGERLKRLRLGRDWTQEELEERSGVNQGTISQIENGQYERTWLMTWRAFGRAFGVPVGFLVDEDAPTGESALADVLRYVEREPEAVRVFERMARTEPPETVERAKLALARTWLANLQTFNEGIALGGGQPSRN